MFPDNRVVRNLLVGAEEKFKATHHLLNFFEVRNDHRNRLTLRAGFTRAIEAIERVLYREARKVKAENIGRPTVRTKT